MFFGVFSVFYVAAQPLISRWIDRRGGYEPILVAGVGLAVMMAVVIETSGVWTLSAAMGITGVFSGALFLASMFVVGRESPEGQRGSAYALWNLAFSLGYLVGPAAGGNLSSLFSTESAFHAFAVFLLVGTAWIYVFTRRLLTTIPH
jgi:MFS family permease